MMMTKKVMSMPNRTSSFDFILVNILTGNDACMRYFSTRSTVIIYLLRSLSPHNVLNITEKTE